MPVSPCHRVVPWYPTRESTHWSCGPVLGRRPGVPGPEPGVGVPADGVWSPGTGDSAVGSGCGGGPDTDRLLSACKVRSLG